CTLLSSSDNSPDVW
nr:immunoglobulin heavy chain junction region [Macaca mulatta]MOX38359.1 immunoglobulin heavy chain junction region [Macaca mulatta]MOX39302.1 immunoglobulin heavy chain junction region [Macaca mulatta]MOX39433.1 immunoglobulin heavy chain junction region [Macaca mulatta]MOX40038.1 immunoglobulin heavy chain junction region [Macaca mulatta]